MKQTERVERIQKLILEYRTALQSTIEVSDRFEPHRLPQAIQDTISLVVADEPKFSNIAALGAANYSISHLIGQARPHISDPIFSRDQVILNTFSVIVSGSGSGKSSTTRKLDTVFAPASDIFISLRRESKAEKAREIAFNELRQENKTLTLDQVAEADYAQFMEPLPRTNVGSGSTRGGFISLLGKLQKEEFSSIGLVYDELAMSIKSGPTTDEIMEVLTTMYDMGFYESPEFKNDEVKESSITEMGVNLLAHTSPTMLFGDPFIRDKLSTLFHTSFARRTFYSHPDDDEAVENNPVPDTITEKRNLTVARKAQARTSALAISELSTRALTKLSLSHDNRLVKFSADAATLYADYFDYCSSQAELLPDSSILQIEMSGRSWKLGKLAAIWSLYQGSNVISKDTLASAIYYTEYNSKYLSKFVRLTTSQPFELMAAEFRNGTKYITLHDAISKGYVKRQTTGFKDILDPINSYLRLDGIVSYDTETKSFIYEELKFVEPQQSAKAATTDQPTPSERCFYTMSYTLLPEGTAKEDRITYLNNFTNYRDNLCMPNLANLLKRDSVYNTFKYKDAPDKHGNLITMNRNRDNIIAGTNLVVLDIDKTETSFDLMHDYLSEIPHIISTTSDSTNEYKYRIILPINVELSGDPKQYAYVVRKLAAELLLTIDPVSRTIAQPFYGYKDAKVAITEDGQLFDVTQYLTEFAKGLPAEDAVRPPVVHKTEKGRANAVNRILDNANQEFAYAINAPMGEGSIMLARASLHMKDSGFNRDEYLMAINFIHDQWEAPMDSARFQNTIVNTYLDQMQPVK